MVQCNVDIEEDNMDQQSDLEVSKHGFHLNPTSGNIGQDKESDTGSMMSKYKIDLMFTINRKDSKGTNNSQDKNMDEGERIKIENNVQEKIDEMFKEVALNDMMKNFYVDYLGSIQLNNDKVQSLETLQEPLKKLYISYKKEKQLKIINKKSVLEITKQGLKLSYGNKLEQINSFSTICVWASVKLITRPHGMNKEFGLEYCFVPLVADYKNNNIKFIKLNQNESYLFPKNTYHDNIPIFAVVMKKMCSTKILEVHAFICNSNDEAINIAANLYKTLLLTSHKNNNKIKQKNGITSCMSVNDSVRGSISRSSRVVSNGKLSSRGSVGNLEVEHRKHSREEVGLDVDSKVNRVNNRLDKVKNEDQQNNFEISSNRSHDSTGIHRYSSRRRGQRPHEQNNRRSSSVESVKNYIVDPSKKKAKEHEAILNESVESIRHYVDYVSEAARNRRRSSLMGSTTSFRRHRSSSVESVKDYEVKNKIRTNHGHTLSRYNSVESMNQRNLAMNHVERSGRSKKHSRGSTESLRRNLRANSVESILDYNNKILEECPEIPCPRRKQSNFGLNSFEPLQDLILNSERKTRQRRNSCGLLTQEKICTNSEFYPNTTNHNDTSDVLRSRKTSLNAQNSSMNRSRHPSINYLNMSSTSINSMAEFDIRDLNLPKKVSRCANGSSRQHRNSGRKDSFTNETLIRKSKHRNQTNLDEIEVCNDDKKENKNGDILTRVAIPRSTSFLKTDSSSRNSLNYSVKCHTNPLETRKTSSSKLGLNEIFQELKNQEGLNNLDEILDVILNTDGMSFNDLKPIYKEFIVKLALILTKDEFYDKCKIIMTKQKKRKKKLRKRKVINRLIHSKINKEMNSLFICGKKKILRKTSSIYKSSLLKRKVHSKKRKHSHNNRRAKDDKNMLLTNDMNTSSGYFTYSECTYDTDACTCISADKCYCNNRSSRGISMSPEMTMLPHHKHHDIQLISLQKHPFLIPTHSNGKNCNTMSSTFPNFNSIESHQIGRGRHGDQHCYHCLRYKTSRPPVENTQICACDSESCNESDKCYCNLNNMNMIDLLKLQGFAASDTSIDSFKTNDYPTTHNWKSNLLRKNSKDKHYIQASKSLEFVHFNSNSNSRDGIGFSTLDSKHNPSSSSFSYKDVGDSSESSALDYNLFHKAKENNSRGDQGHRTRGETGGSCRRTRQDENQNKFLVVSARDPQGRIIYVGADKKHLSKKKQENNPQQTDAISIKKSAEIAALFMKKQNPSADFNEIGYHDLDSGISRRNKMESSLGYLP